MASRRAGDDGGGMPAVPRRWSGLNVAALHVGEAPDQSSAQDVPVELPPLAGFEGLGPHAGAVLGAIAVLGEDAQLSLTRHVAGLGLEDTLSAVELLTGAGVLANSMPLRFVDERTADLVLAGLTMPRQITLRLRAVERMRCIPGAAERVADQLARIGPIGLEWVPEVLSVAAAEAMDGGDWRSAANYLRSALAESPPPEQRVRISRQLALVLAQGNPQAAVMCLLQELRMHDTPGDVAETVRLLRRFAVWLPSTAEIARLFEESADQVHQRSQALAVELYLTRTTVSVFRPEGAVMLAKLERWLTAFARAGGPASRALTATKACTAALNEPGGGAAVELAVTAFDDAAALQEWPTCWLALAALLIAGDDEVTAQVCERAEAALQGSGAEMPRLGCDLVRATLQRRRGDLRSAEASLRAVLAGCGALGLPPSHSVVATATAELAEALVQAGKPDRARDELASAGLLGDIAHTGPSMHLARARGAVAAALGDHERALAEHLECGRLVAGWAELNADVLPWRLDAVRSMLRTGRNADAAALAGADEEAATVWNSPRAKGFAAHARALTAPPSSRAASLAVAAEHFHECGAALEEARALHELAAALRAEGRAEEAAATQARARELAGRCGAALPDDETGVPPSPALRASVLTTQERRIARLVAMGRNNAEIAGELALARRTVEFHLSGVYRKLGISGRRELADWRDEQHDG
ncbi:helix-turn-helix transcriptional regulator [Lentzea sp. DG1S-22]|uniref:helix-turn-helix transcriptional regulator n=1 Tax=Lentzea sp. DG1S-22 TaxID=3108822 RepID=UPI002E7A77A4|nr:helix-turn-helix transcriptional regulator [Lentzea sp. DG1S-22]WVH82414.1 helix-turn-helix transcriptional regulator [Lentzea sp. DG1S-22]